jgi:hypothetical protein
MNGRALLVLHMTYKAPGRRRFQTGVDHTSYLHSLEYVSDWVHSGSIYRTPGHLLWTNRCDSSSSIDIYYARRTNRVAWGGSHEIASD